MDFCEKLQKFDLGTRLSQLAIFSNPFDKPKIGAYCG